MKFLNAFKHNVTSEDMERIKDITDNEPEYSEAVKHACWDSHNSGLDKGFGLAGVTILITWGVVKGLEFFSNRKMK